MRVLQFFLASATFLKMAFNTSCRSRIFFVFALGVGVVIGYFAIPWSLPEYTFVKTQTPLVRPGCFNIGIEFTAEEGYNSQKCVANFSEFKAKRKLVVNFKMEYDRWKKHKYLRPESRIIEVGGFTGVDAEQFMALANSDYSVLEPVPEYYKLLEKKFGRYPKFTLYKFGLAKEDKIFNLPKLSGMATSLFDIPKTAHSNESQTLIIRNAKSFFTSIGVQQRPVDLISINCEGCEFEVLETMIAEKLIQHFKHVQFQFHMDLPNIHSQECRYCQIMQLLKRTHKPMFQHSFVWQCWELKRFP